MDHNPKYNPEIHHRKSIRLKGYDYSQAGLYFITICCANRECLFGEIKNDEMILNDAGKIANECWLEIPKHFPNAILHEYIVMPNHIHGIIELAGDENFQPQRNEFQKMIPRSIGSIVKGYKIGVTKWFRNNVGAENFPAGAENFPAGAENFLPLPTKKIWQRNYHEHIIRNEKSYQIISEYIINNPAKWKDDKFYR